jgi:hypothetical protein
MLDRLGVIGFPWKELTIRSQQAIFDGIPMRTGLIIQVPASV